MICARVIQVQQRRQMEKDLAKSGGVAQLGEHLLCTQGVMGSIPFTSTIWTESGRRIRSLKISGDVVRIFMRDSSKITQT